MNQIRPIFAVRGAKLLFVIALFLALAPSINFAKKEKPQEKKKSGQTFRVTVTLVSVNATVTDKHGNPIKDLKPEDFQVLEDGVPQKISVFKIQVAPGVAVPLPSSSGSAVATSVIPQARKVILFVDDYHLKFEDLVYVKAAGEKFIRTGLGPNDLIALITATGRNSTEFTKYRDYVISSLKSITPYPNHQNPVNCPPMSDYQAYQISMLREHAGPAFDVALTETIRCAHLQGMPDAVQTATNMVLGFARSSASQIQDESRRTLYSIQTLTRRLRAIEGPKRVVFLSDGMLALDLQDQIQSAIDSAIRADTIVDTINARGLDATSAVGDLSQHTSRSAALVGTYAALNTEEQLSLQDTMSALASGTGGTYFHNNNDLFGLMQSAVNRANVSYVLGYYPANDARDGKFRKLVVKVDRPGVVVSARKGYYAPKGDEAYIAEKNEDIKEALESADDVTDIPVTLSFNVTHEDPRTALVAVETRIDVRKIHFQKRENRNRNTFAIVTVVYDSANRFVDGKETDVAFNLTDPNYKNVMKEGLLSLAKFNLPPGDYRVRTVVRDAAETKMGTATKTIDLRN